MKPFFRSGKTLLVLAVAMAAAASAVCQTQPEATPTPSQGNTVDQNLTDTTPASGQGNAVDQTQTEAAPTPATANTLPASVVPGSPLAEVVKLIQAGVDVPTIQSYVANSQSQFNLDADKIIFLKDEGAPSEVINAMMDRDKTLVASTVSQPASPPPLPLPAAQPPADVNAPEVNAPDTTTADTAPPAEDVSLNYFYDSLTPYGTWLNVDGYGQCWRPTTVIYDAGWRPYCDRGHWVYTDYGWYWDSDYGWGTTFHYGRWFHHARYGWCWYPDTVWAPSWVTWRSDTDYCGWAPLPPLAVFMPGAGFIFQGVSVGFDCDFGLGADNFVFVSPANFCNRHPSSFVVPQPYVTQIFSRTKVINSFSASGKTIVNHGFGTERIASVTRRTIDPVHISTLPNAGRQGWRGEGFQQTMQRNRVENINPGRDFQTGNNFNNNGNAVHYRATSQASQQGGYQAGFGAPQPNVNNHVQSQAYYNQQQQQQQQQPQVRQYNNAYGTANERVLQNNQNGWQQNRAYNNASTAAGSQQHGGEQLQQHQYATQPQPRPEEHQTYVESGGRPAPPMPPQNQPQPRNSGNGGNGGNSSNGGGGNSNGGSNKQNH